MTVEYISNRQHFVNIYIYIIVYIIPSIPLFKYPWFGIGSICQMAGSCDQAFNGFEKHQRTWSPGCLAHPLDVRKFPSNVRPCWVSNNCCSLRCKSLLAGKVPFTFFHPVSVFGHPHVCRPNLSGVHVNPHLCRATSHLKARDRARESSDA